MRYYEIVNEQRITLEESALNEAFLNDLAKKLGGSLAGKAKEHITTVNDFATGLKVIGKAVSNEQYLTTSTFEIKRAIKNKLKTLRNIPKFKELNNLINQHWPQGRTTKDFFKSLLIVCGLNSVLAITNKMNNAASAGKGGLEVMVDKLIDNYANIDQIVGSLISSGIGYLTNVLKVMGISNAVLFKTLEGINAKISSVRVGAGVAEQTEI